MHTQSTKEYFQIPLNQSTHKQGFDGRILSGKQQYKIKQRHDISSSLDDHEIQVQSFVQEQKKTSLCIKRNIVLVAVFLIIQVCLLLVFFRYCSKEKLVKQALKYQSNINSFANDGQITSIFVVNNQEDVAIQSLLSYLRSIYLYLKENNQKLILSDILVGYYQDFNEINLWKVNKMKKRINQLLKNPIQIRWISKNKQQFELQFVDNLLSLVSTQFFFFSTTQYIYQSSSSIKNSIQYLEESQSILSYDPKISQLILNENSIEDNNQNKKISFSFSPALHRTKDYLSIPKGFQDISGLSLNMKESQKKISNFYMNKNLYTMQTSKRFGIYKKQIKQFFVLNSTVETKNQKNNPRREALNSSIISNLAQNLKPGLHMIFNQSLIPNSTLRPVKGFLSQIQKKFSKPKKFNEAEKLKQIKQLPICVVIYPSQKYSYDELLQSIKAQNYSNFITISISMEKQNSPSQDQIPKNYYYFYQRIKNQCLQNSLVIFVSSPLLPSALEYINMNHQTYWTYLSYSKSQMSIQIHSFYFRIYQLLAKTDFAHKNSIYLKQNHIELQALGLLEISAQFIIQLQKKKIMSPQDTTYFFVLKNNTNQYDRPSYITIYRLSQDMLAKAFKYNQQIHKQYTDQIKTHMRRALQREQVWYLPQNHSILQIQRIQLNQMYNISKYADISRQVRFCLTILSHNNIQFDRYKKVLKSIVQQKYENFHIVFIDDNSDDNNMNATIQYMKNINFPKNRIKYIQNLKRNFATYNFINTGFNFCDENDIQMLMDGDDQFIGKYAIQVLNTAYQLDQKQNQDVWVAYSNYKNNSFFIGRSRPLSQNFTYDKRIQISVFGPIRTWRVKVIYNIPPAHHKQKNGNWLNTVYDEALFYPLLQVSSVKRIKCIPSILYQYNLGYGDNDNSSQEKLKNRFESHKHVKTLARLPTLKTLKGSIKNKELVRQFKEDLNIKYKVIDQY